MPSRRDNRVSTRGRNNSQQAKDLKGMRGKELEGLGYMYEEISHIDLVQDEVNWVLTAVVQEIELQDFEIGESGDSYPHSHFIEKALSLLVERAFVLLREQLEMLFSDAFRSRATGFSVVSPVNFQRVMTALLESIKDSPHVAKKNIVTSLIATAERTYASDTKLRSAAYETLNEGVFQVLNQKLSSAGETKTFVFQAADQIMLLFLKVFACRSSTVHEEPLVFSCFGDVALAIGENFEKYVPYAMPMMQGVAEVCAQIDVNEEEMVEYGSQLKRSISMAYSGNLQGFKNSKAELMLPHAPHLVKFMELAIKDTQRRNAKIQELFVLLWNGMY
ncbi:importin subunit beta-1 [Tanacetum coccineum]